MFENKMPCQKQFWRFLLRLIGNILFEGKRFVEKEGF